eukprot:TRINITY_DN6092_c0_g1_i1.p2 TRINITY_DN6092_c0_g1~~TRINITY_DN6092_c0_g1_i1.p2  ORF type:complete len:105 (+),score=7.53 TRINITY_DN6092_c0_g1_i1:142-456(+)
MLLWIEFEYWMDKCFVVLTTLPLDLASKEEIVVKAESKAYQYFVRGKEKSETERQTLYEELLKLVKNIEEAISRSNKVNISAMGLYAKDKREKMLDEFFRMLKY